MVRDKRWEYLPLSLPIRNVKVMNLNGVVDENPPKELFVPAFLSQGHCHKLRNKVCQLVTQEGAISLLRSGEEKRMSTYGYRQKMEAFASFTSYMKRKGMNIRGDAS